jgi:hypothetical protein
VTVRRDDEQSGPEGAEHLIARLQGLGDVDRAVLELVTLGDSAIAPLRDFLFRREPSGLYQPRCNAVAALAGLRAEEVLIDFLRAAPDVEIGDPVERTGEDAVINAAARALKHRRDDASFGALMRIAERRRLAGVVEALGEMGRHEAMPRLLDGLASDFTRSVAEAAIRKAGSAARPSLIAIALNPVPNAEFETASSRRLRRSAVGLLCDIGVSAQDRLLLRPLADQADDRLAALVCNLVLAPRQQPSTDRQRAILRLVALLQSADWLLTVEIEGWLARDYEETRRVLDRAQVRRDAPLENDRVQRALRRVEAAAALATAARG